MWYIWKSLAILSHSGLFQIQEALCRWTTAERILRRNFAYHPFHRSVTITGALSTVTPSKVGGLKRRPPPSLRLWRRRTRPWWAWQGSQKLAGTLASPLTLLNAWKEGSRALIAGCGEYLRFHSCAHSQWQDGGVSVLGPKIGVHRSGHTDSQRSPAQAFPRFPTEKTTAAVKIDRIFFGKKAN